jgi:hypothetical protein
MGHSFLRIVLKRIGVWQMFTYMDFLLSSFRYILTIPINFLDIGNLMRILSQLIFLNWIIGLSRSLWVHHILGFHSMNFFFLSKYEKFTTELVLEATKNRLMLKQCNNHNDASVFDNSCDLQTFNFPSGRKFTLRQPSRLGHLGGDSNLVVGREEGGNQLPILLPKSLLFRTSELEAVLWSSLHSVAKRLFIHLHFSHLSFDIRFKSSRNCRQDVPTRVNIHLFLQILFIY